MKRKDWTGGLFFIYLAFVIWVILLKFSTSPDALPHLRNINLIPYGDCLMVNGNLNIRELAENILIFVPFGIYGGMLARERAGGTVILAGVGFSLFLETLQYLLAMGASDITDVINNTLGAVIGVLLWKAFRKTYNRGNCWYVGSECTDLYRKCIEKENVICNNKVQFTRDYTG
jgi:glycopeptide antibiotics resistance protein